MLFLRRLQLGTFPNYVIEQLWLHTGVLLPVHVVHECNVYNDTCSECIMLCVRIIGRSAATRTSMREVPDKSKTTVESGFSFSYLYILEELANSAVKLPDLSSWSILYSDQFNYSHYLIIQVRELGPGAWRQCQRPRPRGRGNRQEVL